MTTTVDHDTDLLNDWADTEGVTLLRLPLRAGSGGGGLGVFGFRLDGDRLVASFTGPNYVGILAYLTAGFQRFDLPVVACAGDQLANAQGSHFVLQTAGADGRLDPQTESRLRDLLKFFLTDTTFRPRRAKKPVAWVCDLFVDVPEDGNGLFVRLATDLADRGVNLLRFRADRLGDVVALAEGQGNPVSLFARMEVPCGEDLATLHRALFDTLPAESRTTLKSLAQVVGGRLVKNTDFVFQLPD